MSKFMDESGVTALTQALISNTKTVGGQSIYGSGNIPTGTPIYEMTITEFVSILNYQDEHTWGTEAAGFLRGIYLLTDYKMNLTAEATATYGISKYTTYNEIICLPIWDWSNYSFDEDFIFDGIIYDTETVFNIKFAPSKTRLNVGLDYSWISDDYVITWMDNGYVKAPFDYRPLRNDLRYTFSHGVKSTLYLASLGYTPLEINATLGALKTPIDVFGYNIRKSHIDMSRVAHPWDVIVYGITGCTFDNIIFEEGCEHCGIVQAKEASLTRCYYRNIKFVAGSKNVFLKQVLGQGDDYTSPGIVSDIDINVQSDPLPVLYNFSINQDGARTYRCITIGGSLLNMQGRAPIVVTHSEDASKFPSNLGSDIIPILNDAVTLNRKGLSTVDGYLCGICVNSQGQSGAYAVPLTIKLFA